MFEDELSTTPEYAEDIEKYIRDMEVLFVLLDALCIKYMFDTGEPVTPFEMNGAIILNTFEGVFGG